MHQSKGNKKNKGPLSSLILFCIIIFIEIFILLGGGKESYSDDGNVTMSELVFKPRIKHNGKILECRSSNPSVQHTPLIADTKLNIQCK